MKRLIMGRRVQNNIAAISSSKSQAILYRSKRQGPLTAELRFQNRGKDLEVEIVDHCPEGTCAGSETTTTRTT